MRRRGILQLRLLSCRSVCQRLRCSSLVSIIALILRNTQHGEEDYEHADDSARPYTLAAAAALLSLQTFLLALTRFAKFLRISCIFVPIHSLRHKNVHS